MKNYETLADALDDLRKRGYDEDFSTQIVCLYCGDLDIRLNPDAFNVDEVYRFDGNSSPDDNATLYAISAKSGAKGTLIDGHGIYSENLSVEMEQKLHVHHDISNLQRS